MDEGPTVEGLLKEAGAVPARKELVSAQCRLDDLVTYDKEMFCVQRPYALGQELQVPDFEVIVFDNPEDVNSGKMYLVKGDVLQREVTNNVRRGHLPARPPLHLSTLEPIYQGEELARILEHYGFVSEINHIPGAEVKNFKSVDDFRVELALPDGGSLDFRTCKFEYFYFDVDEPPEVTPPAYLKAKGVLEANEFDFLGFKTSFVLLGRDLEEE